MLDFRDQSAFFHVCRVASSAEDAADFDLRIAVVRGEQRAGRVIDQGDDPRGNFLDE